MKLVMCTVLFIGMNRFISGWLRVNWKCGYNVCMSAGAGRSNQPAELFPERKE